MAEIFNKAVDDMDDDLRTEFMRELMQTNLVQPRHAMKDRYAELREAMSAVDKDVVPEKD